MRQSKSKTICKRENILPMTLMMLIHTVNMAGAQEAVSKINSLSELFMNILSAMGVMILGCGIFNLAAFGLNSHDPSQMTQGIKSVVAGLLVIMAPQIVNFLK